MPEPARSPDLDKAVEAAARAIFTDWDMGASEHFKQRWRDRARAGLEAALPHLPSPEQGSWEGGFEEGWQKGHERGSAEALREVEEALEAAQKLSASPHTAAVLQRLRDRFRAGGER